MVTPFNLSGNSVCGIENFNLRFWELVADAGELHLHVLELLEPAALLPLPCLEAPQGITNVGVLVNLDLEHNYMNK